MHILAAILTRIARMFIGSKGRDLMKRISRLPNNEKIDLAKALAKDERIPFGMRVLPFLLVFYLAMPFDIVPDFVPILGQLDDLIVVLVGLAIIFRLAPMDVLNEHISAREQAGKQK